jgi:hypothetical protein
VWKLTPAAYNPFRASFVGARKLQEGRESHRALLFSGTPRLSWKDLEAAAILSLLFLFQRKRWISRKGLREIPETLYQIPGDFTQGSVPSRAVFLYIEFPRPSAPLSI